MPSINPPYPNLAIWFKGAVVSLEGSFELLVELNDTVVGVHYLLPMLLSLEFRGCACR